MTRVVFLRVLFLLVVQWGPDSRRHCWDIVFRAYLHPDVHRGEGKARELVPHRRIKWEKRGPLPLCIWVLFIGRWDDVSSFPPLLVYEFT